MASPAPPRARSPQPVIWIQAAITICVLAGTLVLGISGTLASEAVATIFTAALGYVFTAGVQERASRSAVEVAERTVNGRQQRDDPSPIG